MNGGKTWGEMLAEIEALRAENERLREALEVLSVAPAVDCKFCKETARMARAVHKGEA
jgi:hypothetical protein